MATRNRDGSGRHDSSVATSKCSKQSKRLTGFSFNTDPDNRQRSVSLAAEVCSKSGSRYSGAHIGWPQRQ